MKSKISFQVLAGRLTSALFVGVALLASTSQADTKVSSCAAATPPVCRCTTESKGDGWHHTYSWKLISTGTGKVLDKDIAPLINDGLNGWVLDISECEKTKANMELSGQCFNTHPVALSSVAPNVSGTVESALAAAAASGQDPRVSGDSGAKPAMNSAKGADSSAPSDSGAGQGK